MLGRIFDIQRFCIHDGPGIRTTVFLKGCPMRCPWCHNPEGISPRPQLSFSPEKCIGCGSCFRVCPRGAHAMLDGRHVLDRAKCQACGTCVRECPSGALEMVGRDITVEEALEEVLKDEPFYRSSGGGLTLSGGEPLDQADFSRELLTRAKRAGLHTAVETSGAAPWARLRPLRPIVDLWLYDLKETDPARHEEVTGLALGPVLENLRALAEGGAAVLLRLPIVPGLNDRPDHFRAVGALARRLTGLAGVEVLPYHRLGLAKRERLGLGPPALAVAEHPTDEAVRGWVAQLRAAGAKVVNELP